LEKQYPVYVETKAELRASREAAKEKNRSASILKVLVLSEIL